MTVSGLGTGHTPFPAVVPHSPSGPAARTERVAERSRSGFDQLTEADRALIRHVTGERIGARFDPATEPVTAFAATLAAERAGGRLSLGQEVTPVYLKDLDRRLQRTGRNPIGPHLDKAVGYLQGTGPSHFDVSA
jgi:hypothetical protein